MKGIYAMVTAMVLLVSGCVLATSETVSADTYNPFDDLTPVIGLQLNYDLDGEVVSFTVTDVQGSTVSYLYISQGDRTTGTADSLISALTDCTLYITPSAASDRLSGIGLTPSTTTGSYTAPFGDVSCTVVSASGVTTKAYGGIPAGSDVSITTYLYNGYILYDSESADISGMSISAVLSVSSVSVPSTYDVQTGNVDYGLHWSLNLDSGVLTITGNGSMREGDVYVPTYFQLGGYVRSIVIADGVTSAGAYCFSNLHDNAITSVTMADSVASIGTQAFAHINAPVVTIGSGVTYISSTAFNYCNGAKLYISADTPPDIGSGFKDSDVAEVHVHASALAAYQSADGWKDIADRITGDLDSGTYNGSEHNIVGTAFGVLIAAVVVLMVVAAVIPRRN